MTIVHQMLDCKLRDWYNNIPNCDGEHGISYYSTYHSRLCFSDSDRFCMDFISSRFCWVLQFEFLCMSLIQGEFAFENVQFSNCSIATSTQIFYLNSKLGTWTGTRIFDWEPHICRGGHAFTTAKLLLNNWLYHTVIKHFLCNLSQSYY